MTMSIRLGTCTPAAPRRPRRHRDDHDRPICPISIGTVNGASSSSS
jgi:hypothetical protein